MSKKIDFVDKITQGRTTGNPRRRFFDHLKGVSALIEQSFPEEEYLIDAGLFHCIYGNDYYPFDEVGHRDEIRSLIGEKAEKLVHKFCSLENRSMQILQHKFETELQRDLYILEYGNILDVALYDIRNHGTLRPLSYFRLQLIIANLKDHYGIEMPPLPFEPKK